MSQPDPIVALDALEAILTEETRLLEAGRIDEALALGPAKSAAAEALRLALPAGRGTAGPEEVQRLGERQAMFRRILAANLAVIATARNVAETLLREVSLSVAPRGPRTYGPPGHTAPARAGAPITLSRKT